MQWPTLVNDGNGCACVFFDGSFKLRNVMAVSVITEVFNGKHAADYAPLFWCASHGTFNQIYHAHDVGVAFEIIRAFSCCNGGLFSQHQLDAADGFKLYQINASNASRAVC